MIPYLTIKDLIQDLQSKLSYCEQGKRLSPTEHRIFQKQLDDLLMKWFLEETEEESRKRHLKEAKLTLEKSLKMMSEDEKFNDILSTVVKGQVSLVNALLEVDDDV